MRFSLLPLLAFITSVSAAELPLRITIAGEAGPCTMLRWKADWPGCEFEGGIKEGRVEVVEVACDAKSR